MPNDITSRTCLFSACRAYRYRLNITWWDLWGDNRLCNFIMLNPSTADEVANDPTVERCERRARQWGYGGLIVTNIFAFRATDPREMKAATDPVGPENDHHIIQAAWESEMVVVAWGRHGIHLGRGEAVKSLLRDHRIRCHALRVCGDGSPGHPLYVPYKHKPVRFEL